MVAYPKTFYYGNFELELVNRYTYLGVEFSTSGLFFNMAKTAVIKANQNIGAVISLLGRSKTNSWSTRLQLYNSSILSALSFCLGIWGLRYVDMMQRVQVQFFKRLLGLPVNTPAYIVRAEVGVPSLGLLVLKHGLLWLSRLNSMPNSR